MEYKKNENGPKNEVDRQTVFYLNAEEERGGCNHLSIFIYIYNSKLWHSCCRHDANDLLIFCGIFILSYVLAWSWHHD